MISETQSTNMLRHYGQTLDPAGREKLREAVGKVVGEVFLGTLLREFRGSMDMENPFNGGKAAATFRQRLDQELLTRLTASKSFTIGEEVARRWIGDS